MTSLLRPTISVLSCVLSWARSFAHSLVLSWAAPFALGALGALGLAASYNSFAHDQAKPRTDSIAIADFPDVGQLKVLSVDLHTHSVFSDGHVWPSIRAEEAARDKIDGLAITEHLEWQPHISDIPHPDRNRSFEEAARSAEKLDLLIIPGMEITRLGDPGHINAVFIKDANPLVRASGITGYIPEHIFASRAEALAASRAQSEALAGAHRIRNDSENDAQRWAPFASREMYMTLVNYGVAVEQDAAEVLKDAAAQGAFTFWNHPSFAKADANLTRFHAKAIKDGILHGVEIANGNNYYPNAHRLALKHDLAFIGTSDVHQLIAWDYDRQKNQHRPVTLVLAKERTNDAIKQSLFDKRTLVWWNHTLIGRKAELQPVVEASISLDRTEPSFEGRTAVYLKNHSSADWQVQSIGKQPTTRNAAPFVLAAKSVTRVDVRNDARAGELKLKVLNALLAPNEPATISIEFAKP